MSVAGDARKCGPYNQSELSKMFCAVMPLESKTAVFCSHVRFHALTFASYYIWAAAFATKVFDFYVEFFI